MELDSLAKGWIEMAIITVGIAGALICGSYSTRKENNKTRMQENEREYMATEDESGDGGIN